MTPRRSLLLALCAWIAVAAPRPAEAEAEAEADDARERAKALFQEGEKHLAAGRFDEAIAAYEKAYELAPAPGLLYNVGQAHRKKGDRSRALVYYEKYLAAEPNGKASKAARQNIQELRAEMTAEAEAKRKAAEAAAKHKAAEAEAKRKAAEAEAKRKATEDEARRKAAEDEAKRRAAEDEARRKAAEDEAARKAADEAARRAAAPPRPGAGLRIAGWSLAGVGVAGVGLGIVFGLEAQRLSDELSEPRAEWSAELDQKVSDGEAAQRNMILGYTIGGAALVAGGILLYLGYGAKPAEHPPAITWHPIVTPDAAAVSISGSF